jgi:hydroxyacylglutathione hydrolase
VKVHGRGVLSQMLFERIVAEGLAHNSYLIGSGGRAVVIDPRRDGEVYPDIARRNNLTITHIIETHRNEDYVTGSLELREMTGAEILHGARTAFGFGTPVTDGHRFTIGSLDLEIRGTPGHTEESISVVVRDREVADIPYLVFCGDTLFAGDIARTDFYGIDRKAEMAGKIFDSITGKILTLGDGVIVCPAHGAGSVCGGDIADHPFTTIGYEKQTNPLLKMGRDAFIAARKVESPYVPPYFRKMEQYNNDGPPLLPRESYPGYISIPELNRIRSEGCQIVDIRSPTSFGAGHIPGSISIWREGIPSFAGWFLDYETPIVLVDDFNQNLEPVFRHFIRLGYDNLVGVLPGGFPAWTKAAQEIATIPTCSVQELKSRLDRGETPFLLDVRDIKNWRAVGHIPGAQLIYIGELPGRISGIPKDVPVVIYCDAGYKGSLGASILARHQYNNVTNVLGGMTAWKQAGYRIER